MNKLRFGLVGVGQIGQVYLDILQSMQEAQLVAIVDTDPHRLAAITAKYDGVKGYVGVSEMLQESKIQAVIVSSPPVTHVGITQECLEKNVHVLCEKPVAFSSQEAEEIFRFAKKRNAILMMASKFRYVPDIAKAKELITSGLLGNIIFFENAFCSHVDMRERWNSNSKISGGGVIIDNGTHSVDIVRYLLGSIKEVLAIRGQAAQEIKVEDTACILIKTVSANVGIIHLSWSYNRQLDNFISTYGTGGSLHIGWKSAHYRLINEDSRVEFGKGYNKIEALRAQILNFIYSIESTESPLISSGEAIASVRVIEAAYRSLISSQWEGVD